MQYSNTSTYLFYLALSTALLSDVLHLVRIKTVGSCPNDIQFFLPDILINLEKHRDISVLSMLHKILQNVDHSLYCKLPQFAMPIRITWHTAQQNDQ